MSHEATTTMTAAQRALSTVELVSEIFRGLAVNNDAALRKKPLPFWCSPQDRKETLRQCARVRSVWFHEAMRYLWCVWDTRVIQYIPQGETSGTSDKVVDAARRQLYLDFVKTLFIVHKPCGLKREKR